MCKLNIPNKHFLKIFFFCICYHFYLILISPKIPSPPKKTQTQKSSLKKGEERRREERREKKGSNQSCIILERMVGVPTLFFPVRL